MKFRLRKATENVDIDMSKVGITKLDKDRKAFLEYKVKSWFIEKVKASLPTRILLVPLYTRFYRVCMKSLLHTHNNNNITLDAC